MQITRVDAPTCLGGENPLWDDAVQALYYIDNSGKWIHRHDPASGRNRSWEMPDVITTFALRAGGGAVVTLRSGIHLLDLETGALEPLHRLPDPPPFVYNDGTVDPRGRFLIGACTTHFDDPRPDGGLYRLDPDHGLHRIDDDIHFSNGTCFAPDGRTFYFADSHRKIMYAYDYDPETGAATNRRPFAETTALGGLPDGSTVDTEGRVWIAIYGGGKIAAYRPDGALERTIDMPVKLVSSVGFGGSGLDRLFVTTIAHGALGEPFEEGAGDLYVIDGLGAQGQVEIGYAG
jgi:sugar lactone lactonase YvrE